MHPTMAKRIILLLTLSLMSMQYQTIATAVVSTGVHVVRLARIVLSDDQQMQYYQQWNADKQIISYHQIIESFDQVIGSNVILRNTLLIDPVFEACFGLNNTVFADKVWLYITSQHPINCLTKPNSETYIKLLHVYVLSGSTEKWMELSNQWFNQYRMDRQSLAVGPVDDYNWATFLNQMMHAVLYRLEWSISLKCAFLQTYYDRIVNDLSIQPDATTTQLRQEAMRLSASTKHKLSNQTVTHYTRPEIPNGHIIYKYWKACRNHPETKTDIKMIHLFHMVMDKNVLLQNTVLIGPVLAACRRLKSVTFATKVWNYVTSKNPVNCQTKPTQYIYSQLLMVYSSVIPVDLNKCIDLVQRWIVHYKEDKASLAVGYRSCVRNQSFNYAVIFNQMMSIVWFHSNLTMMQRKTHVWNYYAKMLTYNIDADATTNRLVEKSIYSPMICDVENYLLSKFNKLIASALREPALEGSAYKMVLSLFDGFVMQKMFVLKNLFLVELVLEACVQLKDIEFGENVWNYINSDHRKVNLCRMKPTHSIYSRLMDLYACGSAISMTHYEKMVRLVNQWIGRYRMDKGSLRMDALIEDEWEYDIINKLIRAIVTKATNMSLVVRTQEIRKYLAIMIELGIPVNSQIYQMIMDRFVTVNETADLGIRM
eukprot:408383_1